MDHVFVRERTFDTSAIPDTVEELAGLRVGLTQHFRYPKSIFQNPDIKTEYANSELLNIKKLSGGRIDAYIGEVQSSLAALKNSGVTNVVYNPEAPLFVQTAVMLLQPTSAGKIWSERISEILIEMKEDGSYRQIMRR